MLWKRNRGSDHQLKHVRWNKWNKITPETAWSRNGNGLIPSSSVSRNVEYVPVLLMGVFMKCCLLTVGQLVPFWGCGLTVALKNFFSVMIVCDIFIVRRQIHWISHVLPGWSLQTLCYLCILLFDFILYAIPPNNFLRQLRGDVHEIKHNQAVHKQNSSEFL